MSIIIILYTVVVILKKLPTRCKGIFIIVIKWENDKSYSLKQPFGIWILLTQDIKRKENYEACI